MASQLRGIDLAAGGQDAQCNGQIEAPGILGKVGRCQVHGDALVVRELQPGVLQGRAHPLARFLDLHIGQAHQREAGQAVGQVHLDRDRGGLKSKQGAALHQRKAHG